MDQALTPFIHRKVIVLSYHNTAYEAARAMNDHSVGCILVADLKGDISGILTDRDLLLRVFEKGLSTNTKLGDIATRDLKSVNESDRLSSVLSIMEQYSVRRVPVMGRSGGVPKCIGLVSLDDLLATQIVDVSQISRIIKSQIASRHHVYKHLLETMSEESSSFLQNLTNQIGHDHKSVKEFSKFVLSAIVQRQHYTGAVQFIKQLPKVFHQELYDLQAGPDRNIDADYIKNGAATRLRCDFDVAEESIHMLWQSLYRIGNPGNLDHTLFQLPNDIQILLTGGNKKQIGIQKTG